MRQYRDGDGERAAVAPPGPFTNSYRVGVLLVPCLCFLVGAGGRAVLGTGLVGLFVCYILDCLRQQEATFAAVWLTLGAVYLGTLWGIPLFDSSQPPAMAAFLFLAIGQVYFLTGVWASLHFRWLQLSHPATVRAGEHLLFALSPVAAAGATTWGLVTALGAAPAPFYLAAHLAMAYSLLGRPCQPSFGPKAAVALGGGRPTVTGPCSRRAASLHAAGLLLLPLGMYLGVHWSTLGRWEHAWSVALLVAAPALLLAGLPDGLWWASLSPRTSRIVRGVLAAGGLLAGLAGLEGRVVFHSYAHYVPLPPPWSYLLVTVSLYGLAGLALAVRVGVVRPSAWGGGGGDGLGGSRAGGADDTTRPLAAVALVISTASGWLALGAPLALAPAPVVAVLGLSAWAETRAPAAYVAFVGGASAAVAWFLSHHYGGVDGVTVGGLSLPVLRWAILVSAVLALSLPGAAMHPAPSVIVGALLTAQSMALAALECRLAGVTDSGDGGDDGGTYPPWLVVTTSALLASASTRLAGAKRVPRWSHWAVVSATAAKLSVLLLPGHSPLVAALGLSLAASAPHLLDPPPAKGAPVPGWRLWVHGAAMACAAVAARFSLYDTLVAFLDGARPRGALLLAAMVVAAAAPAAAMVAAHRPGAWTAQRPVLLALTGAALLAALQPPLPMCGPGRHRHAACMPWDGLIDPLRSGEAGYSQSEDDAAIYGAPAAAAAGAAAWLLLLALWAGVASTTAAVGVGVTRTSIPSPLGATGRAVAALASGAAAGLYLTFGYLSPPSALTPLLLTLPPAYAAAALVLTSALGRGTPPPAAAPLLWSFLASLPATLMAVSMPGAAPRAAAAGRGTLMAAHAAALLLIAFALRLRAAVAHRSLPPAPGQAPDAPRRLRRAWGMDHDRTLGGDSFGPTRADEGRALWPGLTAAGNAATAACFGLCVALAWTPDGGGRADAACLALSPILLLLSRDNGLLRGLTPRRRYLIACTAAVGYLYLAGWARIVRGAAIAGDPLAAAAAAAGAPVGPGGTVAGAVAARYVLRNGGAWLLTMPVHGLWARFLWDGRTHRDWALALAAPLTFPALVMTDLAAVRMLALGGALAAAAQFAAAHATRTAGLKII